MIKLKGIASRATHRLVSKYGNRKFVDEKYHAFAEMISTDFGIELLKSHLNIVIDSINSFKGTKCLNFSLKYISAAYKNPQLFPHVFEYSEKLLKETIIRIIQL